MRPSDNRPFIRAAHRCLLVFAAACLVSCGGGSEVAADPPGPAAPTGLSYATAPDLTVGIAISPLLPNVTGSVANYTVSPALPGGLSLNASTGAISGIPTTITPSANYTIT